MMDNPATTIISQELRPSETLLWSGRPPAGLWLRPFDLFLIPFSLMWGGMAFLFEGMAIYGVSRRGAWDLIGVIWGIPFVLIGLYLIAGRFYVDAVIRRGTYYGLTNERVIIRITGPFWQRARSLDLRILPELGLTERRNGSGTISFYNNLFSYFSSGGWPGSGPYGAPSFELEQRAREVYQLIRQAQREAQRGA